MNPIPAPASLSHLRYSPSRRRVEVDGAADTYRLLAAYLLMYAPQVHARRWYTTFRRIQNCTHPSSIIQQQAVLTGRDDACNRSAATVGIDGFECARRSVYRRSMTSIES
eukprot:GHVU01004813.1.p1 GENE.GHVU01004813.1~~GHVU01004813.1.p1  ORF type:complete len:110 (+),score=2.27 GHVU01004813.1:188-517(+)